VRAVGTSRADRRDFPPGETFGATHWDFRVRTAELPGPAVGASHEDRRHKGVRMTKDHG
jgi:hypothetical protein